MTTAADRPKDAMTHPTIAAHRARDRPTHPSFSATELRELCIAAGADDVGFVPIGHPALADQRADILAFAPRTRTLISLVCRMNREPIRSPARSVANLEFHATNDHTNQVARLIVANLALRGISAINPPVGFPMEMADFPGKVWVVSHKPVAVAAGLGHMGIHRNVIHPQFGSFILLATVLIDAEIGAAPRVLDYNPCLDCKLCIAACPVGAISENGFNFAACYTHNYREFMGGFTDWVEQVTASNNPAAYRAKFTDGETASIWQSLSFGANYKAAYCLAVCPAGEDVIGPFLEDKPSFIRAHVRPLQEKPETIYVSRDSDAERHVAKRFPRKRVQRVGRVLTPATIDGFINGAQHVFQPGSSLGLNAVYHFRFTGAQSASCTMTIKAGTLAVQPGHVGTPSLVVTADSTAWLKLLRGDTHVLWLLMRRKLRLRGDPRLLLRFKRCFPA